jgi:hypothetical protein
MSAEGRGAFGAAITRAARVALFGLWAGAGACGGAASSSTPDGAALEATCADKIAYGYGATPFSPADFCALYATVCGGQSFTGMLTSASCVATYESWATLTVDGTDRVQSCASAHLCNARLGSPEMHCTHASAEGPCMPVP